MQDVTRQVSGNVYRYYVIRPEPATETWTMVPEMGVEGGEKCDYRKESCRLTSTCY